jgi:hypothetical protein
VDNILREKSMEKEKKASKWRGKNNDRESDILAILISKQRNTQKQSKTLER